MSPNSGTQVAQRESSPATASYAKVLRVIGQDLASFFPKNVEIVTAGEAFEARGQCHPNPFEAVKKSFLDRIWRRVAGTAPAAITPETPPPAPFARTYD